MALKAVDRQFQMNQHFQLMGVEVSQKKQDNRILRKKKIL